MKNLKVLITGVSGDLGRALAKAFSEEGADVAGLVWTREAPECCQRSWKVDLNASTEIGPLFGRIEKEWGGVDVLVNNAGQSLDALLLKTEAGDWEELWRVHFLAAALCSRAVLGE